MSETKPENIPLEIKLLRRVLLEVELSEEEKRMIYEISKGFILIISIIFLGVIIILLFVVFLMSIGFVQQILY